jgi:ribulose-phosphate 3-epimerase
MTVHPGFAGQKFIEGCCSKIAEVKAMAKDRDIIIQVDGGINSNTARIAKAHGANCLVAGSSIFGSKDYALAILGIRR